MSRISLEFIPGRERNFSWGRKDEEYMADFILLARRTLSEFDYKIFRFHFLLGADWKLCCRRMGIDRGTFFHAVYRVQQELGRVYREVEPYSLFPLDEYFYGSVRTAPVKSSRLSLLPRFEPALLGRSLDPVLATPA